jgi:hypothetical protein
MNPLNSILASALSWTEIGILAIAPALVFAWRVRGFPKWSLREKLYSGVLVLAILLIAAVFCWRVRELEKEIKGINAAPPTLSK